MRITFKGTIVDKYTKEDIDKICEDAGMSPENHKECLTECLCEIIRSEIQEDKNVEKVEIEIIHVDF